MSALSTVNELRDAVAERRPRFLSELETLVNIDCGSYTPAGVNRVADICAERLSELGANVERIAHRPQPDKPQLGDLVIGRLAGDGPRLLLIGHMDTVFEEGTASERPFRIEGDRALGPGVSDMKGGLLAGLHALGALHALGVRPSVSFVCNPDEEIGSPFSTPHISRLAAEHDAALVLECARANGDIVSARKGIADYHVTITGRAAHAGVEPEKGRNAIVEAAHRILELHELHGRWPSVTCNVGVIEGGTRPNVVPEVCRFKTDLRAATQAELEAVTAAVEETLGRRSIEGTHASWQKVAGHPVMERSDRTPGGPRAGHRRRTRVRCP